MMIIAGVAVDTNVRNEIAALHGAYQDAIFNIGRWYGSGRPTLIAFASLYLFGIFINSQRIRLSGLLVGESYILSGILTTVTKSLFGRWRPYTDHGSMFFTPITAGPNDQLSFPSGHVTVAFALSSVLAGFHKNIIWKSFWYTLAAITAVSRIYHDQHWLSDVLLSIMFGTVTGVWLTRHVMRNESGEVYESAR
jgi:membrane-associated phospholipid phosphatase